MANKDVRKEIEKMEEKKTKNRLMKVVRIVMFIGMIIFGAVIFSAFLSGLYEIGKQPIVEATVTHTKIEKQIPMSGKVMHEKGKEDTYWVHCSDDNFQVSKADYDTYIKDYNATTVKEYIVKIKGKKKTIFGNIHLPEKVYKRTSYVFKPEKDYTKKEMKELKKEYISILSL